jgi:3-oxoadipate enol-lactonase
LAPGPCHSTPDVIADEPAALDIGRRRSDNEHAMSVLFHTEHGAGPPLVLVHGLMVSGAMFDPVLDRFPHHRLIVPDLRGHGRSRDLPPPFSAAQLASDLAALLDHLGIASTAVLGYSQGGAIAQQLALDHPARCERLVLACTYAFNMASLREKLEGHIAPLLLRALGMKRFGRLVAGAASKRMGKERTAWLAGLIADQDRRLMQAAWREVMAFDSRPRLGELRCPTLVIAAADDQAVPMHHARMLHEGIAGSRLVVIDDADHSAIWTHPDALARAVEDFLDDQFTPYSTK